MTGEKPQPQPVSDIDSQLRTTLREAHRLRGYMLAAVVLLLITAVTVLAVTVAGQQSELKASCEFWQPLTGLPVTAVPPQKMPAALSVDLIVAARAAYSGQGCGKIPPPSPSLVKWAEFYGIKVP